jgi:transposase
MLTTEAVRKRVKDVKAGLFSKHKIKSSIGRNWPEYEKELSESIRSAFREIEPLIDEATKCIKTAKRRGSPRKLTLKQRVTLLLIKELVGHSNRMMANMLVIFSMLNDIDVSYKTIERLYSDPEVALAIHNLHVLMLERKGITDADTSGDGTGYSLTVTKHYSSAVQKRHDKVKEVKYGENQFRKEFVYKFALLDLNTFMYIAYGASLKSEKEAFDKSMDMLDTLDIKVDSIRLDKYYSQPSYVDRFEDAKVYIIPKSNCTIKGSQKWKSTLKEFLKDTESYLQEYYRRESSEAAFSADKRRFGWKIDQKLTGRIYCAVACIALWHNLLNLNAS